MDKTKSILKNSLDYIASRKLLKYSLIIILILLLVGLVVTNKFFNNKETQKQEVLKENYKKKDVTKGTIKTDAVGDDEVETSVYKLNDGYTEASKSNNFGSSNNASSNNKVNSSSATPVNKDKSSLSGIDLQILEGHEFNPKKDLKLKATDKDGSDISSNIIIERNTVDTKNPGTYTVRARVRLSDGQTREKEFIVIVKGTRLDVSLESFRSVKENVKKGEQIVLNLDLKVSKKHITPTTAMINGKEYTLYKGDENIFDKLSNKRRYKVIINTNNSSGEQQYNLEHVKMSNGSWISLGKNTTSVEVLKQEAVVKGFTYEEQSAIKRIKADFVIEDIENTASNLKLEFYKGNKLVQSKKIDKSSSYSIYLPTTSNGRYDLKILADINLNQKVTESNTIFNKEIFSTTINISNVNETSLTGESIELVQGDKFDPIKDLSLKATDFNGEDITDKIVVETQNIDTNVVGKHKVSVYVVNKNGTKYTAKFDVTVKPIAKVIEFNTIKDEFNLNEKISFDIKLQMEKNGVEADKAVINGKEVNLVASQFKNILSNVKTYSAELDPESSDGYKTYSLSKIIMKDGKEVDLNEESNANVLKSNTTINSKDELSRTRMSFNNEKESTYILKNSNYNNKIIGNESDILNQDVTISGSVKKADGSAPEGLIEVELPTVMAFSVDQDGVFSSGAYSITNKSSVGITVSVASFSDSNPGGGITIKPKSESLNGLDRSNLHLDLVGEKNSADLGKSISTPIELLDVNPSGVGTLRLRGVSGIGSGKVVDENGVSEKFSLVLSIKKKN